MTSLWFLQYSILRKPANRPLSLFWTIVVVDGIRAQFSYIRYTNLFMQNV